MWYVLDDNGEPVKAASSLDGIRAFADPRRIVAQQDFCNDICVSTVFLVIDHSHGFGPPLLFETMIFGGKHDQDQWRYTSRADAIAGHEAAITLVPADP